MRKLFLLLVVLMALIFIMTIPASAQQKVDDNLFQQILGKTQEKLNKAKAEQADILSPDFFGRAYKRFSEAKEDLKRGRSLTEIDKKLREVEADLDQAMQTAKVGKVAFATAVQTREDALKANAPQYAPQIYVTGDQFFTEAMRKLEAGDMNGAQKRAAEAERYLRDAELQAIKVSIIGNVRNQITQAQEVKVDKLVPATFAKAQALLTEAEKILNTDRYAAATAREKAEAAEYEIRHANYLAEQIQRMKADERQWEKLFLANEKMVAEVSKELGFSPQFDVGLEKPLNDIRLAVKTLREEQRRLADEVAKQNARMEELNKELNAIREAQTGLESELAKKQQMLLEKQRQEEKLRNVETMFSPFEAKVLREGDNLRIRLFGLTFRSGKYTIEPEYFSLLTKLQRAIREFPNSSVVIEGHTDSIGDDAYNQNLSSDRADAVKQYLMANMSLPEDRLQAVGYGESAPIASNETEDGRAQNRRIDVVISIRR
jgi:outer membrane protein OmpA-like peptidoglycan-associated protein